MSPVIWWIWLIGLFGAGVFFFLFGIKLLVVAYCLTNPFHFIMTFFASNLIILISGTVIAGLGIRIYRQIKQIDN